MQLRAWVAVSLAPDATRPDVVSRWQDRHRRGQPPVWPPEVSGSAVDETLRRASAGDITPIPWSDARYPEPLRSVHDPPPVLWLRGRLPHADRAAVAVVGSRAASSYGLTVAGRLAERLAAAGLDVVSGLARGADAAAHRGSLAAGGTTTAVLGSGLDRIYPAEHASLARAIAAAGALVSELPPGTPPRRHHFPRRNRLIAGLARAVVVIEAAARSGSLITARCGLEQGREVMAVPGDVLSGRSRGGHALIKDGAKLVEDVDDILEELGLHAPPVVAPGAGPGENAGAGSGVKNDGAGLTENAAAGPTETDALVAAMDVGRAYDLDELMDRTGLAGAEVLGRLTSLELDGTVARVAGGRFVRSCAKW